VLAAHKNRDVRPLADDCFVRAGLVWQRLAIFAGGRYVVGWRDRVSLTGFVNLYRRAVEIQVGKVAGRATSSRICDISSQPACRKAGVMNLVQMSRSLRVCLSVVVTRSPVSIGS
jgi:hypothetical protein